MTEYTYNSRTAETVSTLEALNAVMDQYNQKISKVARPYAGDAVNLFMDPIPLPNRIPSTYSAGDAVKEVSDTVTSGYVTSILLYPSPFRQEPLPEGYCPLYSDGSTTSSGGSYAVVSPVSGYSGEAPSLSTLPERPVTTPAVRNHRGWGQTIAELNDRISTNFVPLIKVCKTITYKAVSRSVNASDPASASELWELLKPKIALMENYTEGDPDYGPVYLQVTVSGSWKTSSTSGTVQYTCPQWSKASRVDAPTELNVNRPVYNAHILDKIQLEGSFEAFDLLNPYSTPVELFAVYTAGEDTAVVNEYNKDPYTQSSPADSRGFHAGVIDANPMESGTAEGFLKTHTEHKVSLGVLQPGETKRVLSADDFTPRYTGDFQDNTLLILNGEPYTCSLAWFAPGAAASTAMNITQAESSSMSYGIGPRPCCHKVGLAFYGVLQN